MESRQFIELLLKKLLNQTNFNCDSESFSFQIKKLFNEITINNLIKNFFVTHSFSLANYLSYGTIPNIYEKEIPTPIINKENGTEFDYYDSLITALKNEFYSINANGNIVVSDQNLETKIPSYWLYRLSQAYRREHSFNLLLFKKYEEYDILDQESLEDYLHHVKIVLIETYGKPIEDAHNITKRAKENVIDELSYNPVVKVEDLLDQLRKELGNQIAYRLSRFKLPNTRIITSRIKRDKKDFYLLPIDEQKKYLEQIIIEYLNHNEYANNETQKYLLSLNDQAFEQSFSQEKIISCLLRLFIKEISHQKIDFNNISMADFHIKTYTSDSQIAAIKELNTIIKQIEDQKTSSYNTELLKKLNDIYEQINRLDPTKDISIINKKYQEYQRALLEYESAYRPDNNPLQKKRNSLQNIIHYHQTEDVEDLLFDNNRIMTIIKKAADNGIFYVNEDGKVVIERYNYDIGKIIFRCEIMPQKLLSFLEQCNLSLDDNIPKY